MFYGNPVWTMQELPPKMLWKKIWPPKDLTATRLGARDLFNWCGNGERNMAV